MHFSALFASAGLLTTSIFATSMTTVNEASTTIKPPEQIRHTGESFEGSPAAAQIPKIDADSRVYGSLDGTIRNEYRRKAGVVENHPKEQEPNQVDNKTGDDDVENRNTKRVIPIPDQGALTVLELIKVGTLHRTTVIRASDQVSGPCTNLFFNDASIMITPEYGMTCAVYTQDKCQGTRQYTFGLEMENQIYQLQTLPGGAPAPTPITIQCKRQTFSD